LIAISEVPSTLEEYCVLVEDCAKAATVNPKKSAGKHRTSLRLERQTAERLIFGRPHVEIVGAKLLLLRRTHIIQQKFLVSVLNRLDSPKSKAGIVAGPASPVKETSVDVKLLRV
jgi:hypothetical protein